ncbi:hypothetical protein PP940_gp146 [Rhizobium phage RL2RES]|uniref:Uncharacterized protein n=1 Tax=Rhizobium phage RL2RES TaxID=103371 RepID=A0A6B9J3Q4_9CAUD|nr:hypothetical protein PP940_gp146 [Rhizobium phage RL2RES]QGZ14272.1 hypothetical protein RL2RES_146 [Rhizobium phage RL2RES]
MAKQTFKFQVTMVKEIHLTIDPDKLTKEIMEGYNDMITWVGDEPKQHLENIAEQAARGQWWNGDKFLEGYGDLTEFEASVNEFEGDIEVEKID